MNGYKILVENPKGRDTVWRTSCKHENQSSVPIKGGEFDFSRRALLHGVS
jgi:hypothetical protein